jgi:hypothetical protein
MTQARIKELGEFIQSMDCYSQNGLDRIEALARLAQLAMQAPEAYQCLSLEAFAHVFAVIEEIAGRTMDDINSTAEQAGNFHYRDSAAGARQDARHRWRLMTAETGRA